MTRRYPALILEQIREIGRAYVRKDFTNKSAALSFYTIISILPLALVLVTIVGRFVPPEVLVHETMRLIEQFFPVRNAGVVKGLETLLAKRRAFGWVGGMTLVFTSRLLYLNLERFVNELLSPEKRRGIPHRVLFFPVWLFGSVLVLLTPLLLGGLRRMLEVYHLSIPHVFGSRAVFLASAFLMFLCSVLVLPARRLPPGRMLTGGLFFAAALIGGQIVFKMLVVRSVAQYNLVYGSLATVILGLVWIFYFYQMFLILIDWTGRKEKTTVYTPVNV